MKINLKKIIELIHSIFGREDFGLKLNAKRDLSIIFFSALILIIISGFYSFRLFTKLEIFNNFFNSTPEEIKTDGVINIEKLKEKLKTINEANGCFVKFEKNIFNIKDPSL